MRNSKTWLPILTGILLFLSCSTDPIQKGDSEFANGNYAAALKSYLEAYQKNPDAAELKEKIAVTMFRDGLEIYQKRRVVSAFEARVKRGLQYVGQDTSESLKSEISNIYYQLAMAYKARKAENPRQKQENFDKTLEYLSRAVSVNPDNNDAQTAYEQLMTQNFASMLNRGIEYYKQGEQNPDNYLNAEYYLSKALQFKPEDAQAKKYLRLTRQAALGVMDMDREFPIAITDEMRKGNVKAMYLVIRNNSADAVDVSAQNFYLILSDGKAIPGFVSKEFAKPFAATKLLPDREAEGVVAFNASRSVTPVRLEFRVQGTSRGGKYLP